jgi:polyisoprenoid-binding protein YceI
LAAAGATAAAGSSPGALAGLDGSWKVDPSLGSGDTGSFVGYRAQEQLATIGANVAVGRTSSVTGSFTLTGTTVNAASFTADLSTLKSDSSMRDGMIQRTGLESSQFPTATFELTSPIDLGTLPADGTVVKVTATGKLTVHGVTKVEQFPLQAKRSATVIAIAGSLDVKFADFGMQAPTSSIALSVADPVTIEFQLLFSKQ